MKIRRRLFPWNISVLYQCQRRFTHHYRPFLTSGKILADSVLEISASYYYTAMILFHVKFTQATDFASENQHDIITPTDNYLFRA
jgi:hypothetical protein